MTVKKTVGLTGAAGSIAAVIVLYRTFGAFLPWREAAEIERLIEVAGIQPGHSVGEIGAGSGKFTAAVAARVGANGRVYATELSADNLAAIRTRVSGLGHVTVLEGAPLHTNLPDGCCDVVFMRNVYHHLTDPREFGQSLERAVRTNGRLVVLDFEPGGVWFLGKRPDGASDRRAGHGVSRAEALAELTPAGFRLEQDIASWSGPMWFLMFRKP